MFRPAFSICAATALVLASIGGSDAFAGGITPPPKLYYSEGDPGAVKSSKPDGSGKQDVLNPTLFGVPGMSSIQGLVLDPGAQQIYFTDAGLSQVRRVDTTGANPVILVDPAQVVAPEGIDLDLADGKMYWSDPATGLIQRANLDGSNVEVVIDLSPGQPEGIALDPGNNQLYFADRATGIIGRINVPAKTPPVVIVNAMNPRGIALDLPRNRLYFSDSGTGSIVSTDLQGMDPQIIADGQMTPEGLDLDPVFRVLYWTDSTADTISRATVPQTSTLDGGMPDVEIILDMLNGPTDVSYESGSEVPAVSDWGIALMMLLVLTGASLVFRTSRAARAA